MNVLPESFSPAAPSITSRQLKEKILLVSGDPSFRLMFTLLLDGEGYNVFHATDGVEALDFSGDADFHLVLLDLDMPGVCGWDAFEQISEEYPLLPVIIITARPNQRFAALAAGAGALMEKPLDLQKLLFTIRDLLAEPVDVRIARMAGRPSEFHYAPPKMRESGEDPNPWRRL